MLTPLGQQIRRLRIDKGIKLKDMAEDFGVRSSFLSAVENGRKQVPRGWVEKLDQYFANMGVSHTQWWELAELSRPKVTLDLVDADRFDRETCVAFGRHYLGLSPERKQALRKMLEDD